MACVGSSDYDPYHNGRVRTEKRGTGPSRKTFQRSYRGNETFVDDGSFVIKRE